MKRGDKVQFRSKKGKVEGVVIGTRWSRKGQKVARQLNASYGSNIVPEGRMVAEVADFKNDCIWTISTETGCVIGKASRKTVDKGLDLKGSILAGRRAGQRRRLEKNVDRIDENNLRDLQGGDTIEIKYRDGLWRKQTFSHFTGSGKVAFRSPYTKKGVRYAWPKWARLPK